MLCLLSSFHFCAKYIQLVFMTDIFNLRESINDSVFVGLNNTNQVDAKLERLSKSVFRQTSVIDGFPTIEKLVSSTKII